MLARLRLSPVALIVGATSLVVAAVRRGASDDRFVLSFRESPLASMEKLHHQLWVTQAVNAVFGPIAAAILRAFGRPVPARRTSSPTTWRC